MSKVKNIITLVLVLLIPLFFLPITQEYFILNKIYLLGIGALVLLLVSITQLFITKKIVWKKSPFDMGLSLLLIAEVLSILVVAPNKVEAILNPYFGLMMFVGLIIFYFALSQKADEKTVQNHLMFLEWAGFIVAALVIIFYYNPFKNVAFPTQFQFLKFSSFSPIGNQLDLAVFLGFMLILQLGMLFYKKRNGVKILPLIFFGVFAISLIVSVYSIIRPETAQQAVLLTPFRQSWFSAVEILKNPLNAILGVGVGNFASVFTLVKDASYNSTLFWQVSGFNISRSAILHIFTETGIIGLAGVLLVLFSLWKELVKLGKDNPARLMLYLVSGYTVLALVLLPPSFISFFLFVFTLYLVFSQNRFEQEAEKQELDLKNLVPIYFGIGLVLLVFAIGSGYFLGRSYLAEYKFKKSIEGYAKNDVLQVYNNQRDAVLLNPYVERFHTNYAQTNLLIANNIASQVGGDKKLTDQQRQTIVQAVQAAINESKTAVALNPQKATNWENLAGTYRYVVNAVEGADVWTVSSYQRAIQLDPVNPVYRLNLGGVYYSLQKYNDAANFFAQAVSLKSDWANAHYNLAWASYQLKDYQRAASEMQNVLKLIDKKQSPDDYVKAQKEYEQFKSQIPKEEAPTKEQTGNLQLPTQQQQPVITPKLELPQNASPEAR